MTKARVQTELSQKGGEEKEAVKLVGAGPFYTLRRAVDAVCPPGDEPSAGLIRAAPAIRSAALPTAPLHSERAFLVSPERAKASGDGGATPLSRWAEVGANWAFEVGSLVAVQATATEPVAVDWAALNAIGKWSWWPGGGLAAVRRSRGAARPT